MDLATLSMVKGSSGGGTGGGGDKGYEENIVEIFNETIDTMAGPPNYFSCNENVYPDMIVVNFDGVDYLCSKAFNQPYYVGVDKNTPFSLNGALGVMPWSITVSEGGVHTVKVSSVSSSASSGFRTAVLNDAGAKTLYVHCGDLLGQNTYNYDVPFLYILDVLLLERDVKFSFYDTNKNEYCLYDVYSWSDSKIIFTRQGISSGSIKLEQFTLEENTASYGARTIA